MKRKKFQSAIEYFFIFYLVFFSQDTLLFGLNSSTLAENILYASLPIAIVLFFVSESIVNKTNFFQRNLFNVTIALCTLSLVTMGISEHTFSVKYGYECLMIIFAFLLCNFIPFDGFRKKFCAIIVFLATFSLVCFGLRYLFPGFFRFFPVLTNEAGYEFYCLFFASVPLDRAYVTFRNFGIFREPSMYQVFLNLALILILSEKKERESISSVIILIAAIVTTFSTSGYILCFLVFFTYFFKKRITTSSKTLLLLLGCTTLVAFLFLSGAIDYDHSIFTKLFTNNSSSNSRFGAFLVDTYIGLENIIWGKGFAYTEANFHSIALSVFNLDAGHNTNTLLKMFAVHGALFFSIYCIGFFHFFKAINCNFKWLIYCSIFFLSLSSADLIFNTVIYVIMFYGYKRDATHEEKCSVSN